MTSRTIIVTGGFGILGQAVAAAFSAHGDHVARVDYATAVPRNHAALDIGGVDITKQVVADKVIADVEAAIGSASVLVNIAGGFAWESFEAGGPETWERMFRMNVLTAACMTKATLPRLKIAASASIINIGAGAALKAAAGMGSYAASKSAVHRLTESLAEELKTSNITVNAILPSIIDTPANRHDMPSADFSEWVKPEAIADVVLFLASPASRAISGALIPVSRGSLHL